MLNKVFVYGTLMSSGPVRGLNKFNGAAKVADATTADATYSLFNLGPFPGATLNGHDAISGEVWSVDQHTMEQLDAIEGYPNFYNRTEVATSSGVAWMYYLNDETSCAGLSTLASEHGNPVKWTNEIKENQ